MKSITDTLNDTMRCGMPGRWRSLAPLGDADAADLAAALIELAANT
jgi:hypothetical protein